MRVPLPLLTPQEGGRWLPSVREESPSFLLGLLRLHPGSMLGALLPCEGRSEAPHLVQAVVGASFWSVLVGIPGLLVSSTPKSEIHQKEIPRNSLLCILFLKSQGPSLVCLLPSILSESSYVCLKNYV